MAIDKAKVEISEDLTRERCGFLPLLLLLLFLMTMVAMMVVAVVTLTTATALHGLSLPTTMWRGSMTTPTLHWWRQILVALEHVRDTAADPSLRTRPIVLLGRAQIQKATTMWGKRSRGMIDHQLEQQHRYLLQ
jgi:hypothetical protein